MIAPKPRRGACTAVFAVYAACLFAATHWPNLRIESRQIDRPDILIHIAAFAIWTVLLALSGLVGPWLKSRTALLAGAVALAFAAFDEASQALPILGRTAALDDYLADVAGIVIASLVVLGWSTLRTRGRNVPGAGDQSSR